MSRFHIGCGGVRIFAAMVGILLNSCSQRELQPLTPDSPQRSIPARLEYRAEACDSIHKRLGFLSLPKTFGAAPKAVSHSRLLADISRSGHRCAKPSNSLRRRQPCRSVSDFWYVPATTLELVFVWKSSSEQRRQLPSKTCSKMMPPAWIREL